MLGAVTAGRHHCIWQSRTSGVVATELDGSPSLAVTASYVPRAVTPVQAHVQPMQVRSCRGFAACGGAAKGAAEECTAAASLLLSH